MPRSPVGAGGARLPRHRPHGRVPPSSSERVRGPPRIDRRTVIPPSRRRAREPRTCHVTERVPPTARCGSGCACCAVAQSPSTDSARSSRRERAIGPRYACDWCCGVSSPLRSPSAACSPCRATDIRHPGQDGYPSVTASNRYMPVGWHTGQPWPSACLEYDNYISEMALTAMRSGPQWHDSVNPDMVSAAVRGGKYVA